MALLQEARRGCGAGSQHSLDLKCTLLQTWAGSAENRKGRAWLAAGAEHTVASSLFHYCVAVPSPAMSFTPIACRMPGSQLLNEMLIFYRAKKVV